ncbi:MAG: hypothetical protein MUF48_08565 [Pirellulaceae bacterium]|jgi:hypothetical protein|nr:hypothetical protein [Pirellulaceae bacterium]
MTLEAYAYCPGGTGKRIKHCACRDITGELDKIIKAIEGEQRIAALDRINRLLATRAHRPCLLALKISTLLGMNNMQGLEETVTTFTKVAPDNPLAHAYAAILEARKHRVRAAVDELQTAMSLLTEVLPGEMADAFAQVAHELLEHGEYPAAVGHFRVLAQLNPDDQDTVAALMSLHHAEQVPLGLKRGLDFQPCPEQATWRSRFETALRDVRRGFWRRGLEKFEKLNQDFPHQSAVWWNIAVARSLLALPTAAEAFHAYARCEGVSLDDAVRAETLAHMHTHEVEPETVDLVQVTLPVADASALQERMLSSPRLVSMPVEQYPQRDEDSPPPKAVFAMLDRPALDKDAEPTCDNIPRVLTLVALFGKETDRPARLLYTAPQSDTYQAIPAALAEIAGEHLVSAEESRAAVGKMSTAEAELFVQCFAPERTTFAQRARLSADVVRQQFRNRWRHLPHAALDRKTPAEVAPDPAYRIRLAAALELLDQTAEIRGWEVDVDQLRRDLGVPVPDPIDPDAVDLDTLAPTDWARVPPERLSNEDLLKLWHRADLYSARRAVCNLGKELLRRENLLAEQVELGHVCEQLARSSNDSDLTLEYLRKARQYAAAKGYSAATHLLNELPLRLLRGEAREATQVLTQLQRNHMREPGVAETLYHILERFGVVGREPVSESVPEPVAAAAESAPAAALWTPGSPPTAAQEQKSSKLWLPD